MLMTSVPYIPILSITIALIGIISDFPTSVFYYES